MKFLISNNKKRSDLRMRNHYFRGVLTAFLLMAGTTVMAQERENVSLGSMERFNQTDQNTDQRLDKNEFVNWMREEGIFDDWDADRDGRLTKEEVDEGSKKDWNRISHVIGNYFIVESENENNGLDKAGIANPKLDLDRIDDWDLDNDGYYSEAEMQGGVFDFFDGDGNDYVDYDEFSSTYFPDQYTE